MLKVYMRLREGPVRLRRIVVDANGSVSLEYGIVATCIAALVVAAFSTDSSYGIGRLLHETIGNVVAQLP